MTKKFSLSKEELRHFEHLSYARDYLEQSINQFIATIITERLDEKPEPDQAIDWKLDKGELILEIKKHEQKSFYQPDGGVEG